MNVCIVCSFITQISFLVIPEICLTASVIHSKLKLITNIDFVLTLGPEAEHLTLNFVCKLVSLACVSSETHNLQRILRSVG